LIIKLLQGVIFYYTITSLRFFPLIPVFFSSFQYSFERRFRSIILTFAN
jgi:hypothetical protein